jgi:hypothetical protein
MAEDLYRRAATAIVARAVSEGVGVNVIVDALLDELANVVVASTAGRSERDQSVERIRHFFDQKVVDREHKLYSSRRAQPPEPA